MPFQQSNRCAVRVTMSVVQLVVGPAAQWPSCRSCSLAGCAVRVAIVVVQLVVGPVAQWPSCRSGSQARCAVRVTMANCTTGGWPGGTCGRSAVPAGRSGVRSGDHDQLYNWWLVRWHSGRNAVPAVRPGVRSGDYDQLYNWWLVRWHSGRRAVPAVRPGVQSRDNTVTICDQYHYTIHRSPKEKLAARQTVVVNGLT